MIAIRLICGFINTNASVQELLVLRQLGDHGSLTNEVGRHGVYVHGTYTQHLNSTNYKCRFGMETVQLTPPRRTLASSP